MRQKRILEFQIIVFLYNINQNNGMGLGSGLFVNFVPFQYYQGVIELFLGTT